MSRLPLAAFAALAAATVGAFFVTQHLKVSTPLIAGFPKPTPAVISPAGYGCGGSHRVARFSFYLLHRADDVAVYVVDQTGTIVRTLASGRHMRRGVRNPDGLFQWDGREDNGRVAPDGTYYFRVALLHQNRTVEYTRVPVTVKSSPPHPVVTSVSPALIPQGGAPAQVRYRGNEQRPGTVRIYRDRPAGRPAAGQALPRRVAGRHLGRQDRPAPGAGGHLPVRPRGARTRPATRASSHPRSRPCRARLRTPESPSATWPQQPPLDPVPAGSRRPSTWTPASSRTPGRSSVRG